MISHHFITFFHEPDSLSDIMLLVIHPRNRSYITGQLQNATGEKIQHCRPDIRSFFRLIMYQGYFNLLHYLLKGKIYILNWWWWRWRSTGVISGTVTSCHNIGLKFTETDSVMIMTMQGLMYAPAHQQTHLTQKYRTHTYRRAHQSKHLQYLPHSGGM